MPVGRRFQCATTPIAFAANSRRSDNDASVYDVATVFGASKGQSFMEPRIRRGTRWIGKYG